MRATSPPSQGQTVFNHGRASLMRRSQRTAPAQKKNIVYFERSPIPANSPATSHHQPLPPTASSASAHIKAAEQASAGGSGTIGMEVTVGTNIKLKKSAARTPSSRSPSRSEAVRHTQKVATETTAIPILRTPNAVSPNSAVPARIKKATAGGWSKYPSAKWRD